MKPILVEPHSPSGFGKVSFATSGSPNFTNTGDIHKKKEYELVDEPLTILSGVFLLLITFELI